MQRKQKKKLFKKILLGLLIIVLSTILVFAASKIITSIRDKKIKNSIESLNKGKTSYVFVEINPSMMLTVKNKKVINVTCLNKDCLDIYNSIIVEGKNINDSISDIYKTARSKGYNTDKIKIKTTDRIEIDEKEYISIEFIDELDKDKLLKEANINKTINDNIDYYRKLWNELKKDKDYGYVYNCRMENTVLKCFINVKEDIRIDVDDEDMGLARLNRFRKMMEYNSSMVRVFNKFGIETSSDTDMGFFFELSNIYINGKKFEFNIYDWLFYDYNNNGINYYFELSDLNLLNPAEVLNKVKSE